MYGYSKLTNLIIVCNNNLYTGATAGTLSTVLGITREEAEKLQKAVRDFKSGADMCLEPGERFIFSGTLSLAQTVSVMNENAQFDKKDCWTGPTDKSENEYTISSDFTNLSREKKFVTVYS